LRELGILADRGEDGYLLQIYPAGAGPADRLFRADRAARLAGFGKGSFKRATSRCRAANGFLTCERK
jgi:4-hydroxyphenylpyruvate dioxygenase-like putative hemolysin